MREEVGVVAPKAFLPFRFPPARRQVATEIRSTVIVSGLQAVRARGLHERYIAQLAAGARDDILSLIAGTWVPIALGVEHYRAMERLALDPQSIDSIGAEVADRLNRSALSIIVKLSKEAGVTPWTALVNAHRITDLNWKGSDVTVHKLGPKEARYEWVGQPCAQVPYFIAGFGGFLRGLSSLFCTKAYVRPIPERCASSALAYRLSWV